jgi:hypothetical protein
LLFLTFAPHKNGCPRSRFWDLGYHEPNPTALYQGTTGAPTHWVGPRSQSRAVGAAFVSPALQRGEATHINLSESRRDGAEAPPTS